MINKFIFFYSSGKLSPMSMELIPLIFSESLPKVISRVFTNEFLLINIASVSGQCVHYIKFVKSLKSYKYILSINLIFFFSSGKLSPMSMELTPLAPTMATAISNWRESTYTTMKPQAANMSPALFWLISNPVPWTQSDRDLMAKFSDQITLFSDSREQETTGQRDITQKVII